MAALEAQTRFTTGSLGHDAGAGPSDSLPLDMDEAAYQAMLQQARAASHALRCVLRADALRCVVRAV